MTEKLKVSREVADGIEYVKREGYDYTAIMKIQINNGWERKETMPLLELSLEQLATALIVGYEVEKTTHEVIAAEYVTSQQEWFYNMHFHSKGFAEGIEFTLNTLGITIKGVNDNETI